MRTRVALVHFCFPVMLWISPDCNLNVAGSAHLYICCHCACNHGRTFQVLDLQRPQQEEPCSCCYIEEHGSALIAKSVISFDRWTPSVQRMHTMVVFCIS